MRLRAVVVDDEQAAVDDLVDTLSSDLSDQIEIVGIAGSVEQGKTIIMRENPDVIFLDVQLTDGTGFDLLRQIPNINFKIIFTSAYNEFALQAFRFSALDFILKPIDVSELKDAVKRACHAKEKENIELKLKALFNNLDPGHKNLKRLILNSLDSIEIVEVKDIIRCEAKNNYTQFHFVNGRKLLISKTLKDYERLLTSEGFFRLHSSHLINLKHVQKIDKKHGSMVLMKDDSMLPISIKKKDDLLKAIETF
jgi:two-component system, LytTR family, response regulator